MQHSKRTKTASSFFHKSLIHVLGFYAVWIVYLGKKTGLFESIASEEQPIHPTILAQKNHLHAPAVEGWCSAAVCLGYLSEKNGRVFLTPKIRDVILDDQSPYYVAGQFAYSALRSLEYNRFDDLFKAGKAKPPTSPETFKAIEEATSWDHQSFLRAVKTHDKKIHTLLSQGGRVLDVGCGAGKFMQRVQAVYPRSEFIGIDPYAEDIRAAKEFNVKQMTGLKSDRGITILRGDAETMTFKEDFDLLYLGESLYIMHDKQQAIRNCYNALKKGGTIAILEGLLTEVEGCRICEQEKMIMAMQLDFVLQGYPFMKKKQVLELLKGCGFKNIKFIHLGVSFYLITANKAS